MLKDSKTDMDFHTIILKTTRLSFFDKAGCTRQFESELSMRSFAQLFPLKKAPPLSPSLSSIVFTTPFGSPYRGQKPSGTRGCNRPPVLRTASLYGWRTIRDLRQQQSCGFLCGDEPAFTQGFAKSICPFWACWLRELLEF